MEKKIKDNQESHRKNDVFNKQALRRFLWAAQLNFDFDADKLLMNCKLCANYLLLVFELCAISEQIVCKHRHIDKNTLVCKCIQNQNTVQVYTKPVYCTIVHKTSLLYNCTQNQFTVQV